MLQTVLVAVGLLVALLLALAATRPASFRVQRSTRIAAGPGQVFEHLADFHRWAAWSPWEDKDPAMKRTHSGAQHGVGAVYEWDGNNAVGKGRMEITQATPPTRLVIKLDFIKPFQAHNTAEFTLQAEDGGTTVTWAVHGPSPFLSRLIGLFVSMDRMIGGDFETGLARLKKQAEC